MFDSTFCCLVRVHTLKCTHTPPPVWLLAVHLQSLEAVWGHSVLCGSVSVCALVGEGSSPNANPSLNPMIHTRAHTHKHWHTYTHPSLHKPTDDVPSSCIFVTVTMSAPAKRPATRVTSAPVSVATAILPKSARQPAHNQGATTGGNERE